jgi:3-oxoacyl-[acyl-carrier protein] reductase
MRHAVVTGAASGIGRAIARELAADGWRITGVDLQADALAAALSEIEASYGSPATAITGDLADADFPARAVDTAWASSPVDALVNAAAIYPAIRFLELTAQSWDRVQHINVRAPVLATQALARLAIEHARTPAIVNIASGAARRARPGTAHYSTSKAALVMATQASAVELGSLGIRVNAVAPGFIDVASAVNPVTDEYADAVRQSVLPGRGTPQDIAGAVLFLLSDQARWISGVVLSVDGGSSAGTSRLPPHWTGQTAGQLGTAGG